MAITVFINSTTKTVLPTGKVWAAKQKVTAKNPRGRKNSQQQFFADLKKRTVA
jgi:hypothetical protein